MAAYPLISSDSHVVEPPDLWTTRIDAGFRDRAPFVVEGDEADQWYVEAGTPMGQIGANLQAGVRFEDPDKLTFEAKYRTSPRGAYDPHARLVEMSEDHVSAEVLYSSLALSLFQVVQDDALLAAIFRAYNDWLADFIAVDPKRLKGIAVVPVDDVDGAAAEVERCAGMGLVGAMIPVVPAGPQYDSPAYDPLWAAAQDAGTPVTLHIATSRKRDPLQNLVPFSSAAIDGAVGLANRDVPLRTTLAAMIFGGVFQRFPGLRIVVAEYEISWAPYFVREMDRVYGETAFGKAVRAVLKTGPGETFRRNVFISFQEDRLGVSTYVPAGTETLMWGSDYPHAEGTFPHSRKIVEEVLDGLGDRAKRKLAGANAAALYGFADELA